MRWFAVWASENHRDRDRSKEKKEPAAAGTALRRTAAADGRWLVPGALRRTAELATADSWCAAADGGGGCSGCCGRLLQGHCGGRRRGPVARMKMPRNGVAQGLKVEAVLAAEAAWEQ